MQAVVVEDRDAGLAGLSLAELPYPPAAENDVVVRVHAAGMTAGELEWPTSWSDRAGRDRTPSVPGHEVSGVVDALGYGTTGLTVGQRVFGLTDWARNGTLAEYVAVEARNLAPLPAGVDHTVAAASVDLRADGVAGPVRPRPRGGRPDRAGARRRGRGRIGRRAARGRRRLPRDRHRPRCAPRPRARVRRGRVRRSRGRAARGGRRGGRRVRRARRRCPRAFGRAGARRRHPRDDRRAAAGPAGGRAGRLLRRGGRSRAARRDRSAAAGRDLVVDVGAVRPLPEAPAALGPDAPHVHGRTIIRVAEG